MSTKTLVVVPWHNQTQIDAFCKAWEITLQDKRIVFTQDTKKQGCARTKDRGIRSAIYDHNATIVIVLDDDCYPYRGMTLDEFMWQHELALHPQPVTRLKAVTSPPSRGTPYFNSTIDMSVAASMGFWHGIGDYDAPGQLVHGAKHPMEFDTTPIYEQYFPLCGMNIAFKAAQWPWCQFVDVPRFDDIWGGFMWQRNAYDNGLCFNLSGPPVQHSRQSNVWANLIDEAQNLERNETIWQDVDQCKGMGYEAMSRRLGITDSGL